VLGIPPVSARIAGTVSAIGLRYPAPPGADHRVGTRAPDLALSDGRTLFEALRGGRFVLLGRADVDLPDPVDAAEPSDGDEVGGLTLVRPDGYVAWAGTADRFPAWADAYFGRRAGVRRTEPTQAGGRA